MLGTIANMRDRAELSLVRRNENMAREIDRLRYANHELKRMMRKLLKSQLQLDYSRPQRDQSTQTDSVMYNSPNSMTIANPAMQFAKTVSPERSFVLPRQDDELVIFTTPMRDTEFKRKSDEFWSLPPIMIDVMLSPACIQTSLAPAVVESAGAAATASDEFDNEYEYINIEPQRTVRSQPQKQTPMKPPKIPTKANKPPPDKHGREGKDSWRNSITPATTQMIAGEPEGSQTQIDSASEAPTAGATNSSGDIFPEILTTILFESRSDEEMLRDMLALASPAPISRKHPAGEEIEFDNQQSDQTHTPPRQTNSTSTQSALQVRPRRSISQPLSYSETPLNVKVRKGFQFFKFPDSEKQGLGGGGGAIR